MFLSLVMIARDEERCIARALQSVKPYVDEMIVVDTGSTDNTVHIAKALGATVHHFTWINDFSAARNYALELASGDWRLVIDADEYLVSGGDVLQAWSNTAITVPTVKTILVKNLSEQTENQLLLPRILSRAIRYHGIVHEEPCEPFQLLAHTDVLFEHDGYLPQYRFKKDGRNIALLQAALKDTEKTTQKNKAWYYHFQLGSEYWVNNQFIQCQEQFQLALDQPNDNVLNQNPAIANDFAAKYLLCLSQTGDFKRGVVFARTYLKRFENCPEFSYALGVLLSTWSLHDPTQLPVFSAPIEIVLKNAIHLCLKQINNNQFVEGTSPVDCLRLAREQLEKHAALTLHPTLSIPHTAENTALP